MALPDSVGRNGRGRGRFAAGARSGLLDAPASREANPFTQHFIDFTQSQCWGYAWLRDGLSHKTRSMLNVCLLAGLGRWPEFEVHIRGALNNGVTPDEIAEILLHTAVYAGIPVAADGFRRADKIISEVAAEKKG
jgi:4-carboxymuconolactone decarboxylase